MRGYIENTVLDDWIAIAENFKSSIDKMLNEVHTAKMELMLLQNEIIDRLDAGQYIRDDQRIIISAPLMRSGILKPTAFMVESWRSAGRHRKKPCR